MKKKEKSYQTLDQKTNGLSKPMKYTLRGVLQCFRATLTISFFMSAIFFAGIWFMQTVSIVLLRSTLAGADNIDWMSFVGTWAPPMVFVIIVVAWLMCVVTKFVWVKLGLLCDMIKSKLNLDVQKDKGSE